MRSVKYMFFDDQSNDEKDFEDMRGDSQVQNLPRYAFSHVMVKEEEGAEEVGLVLSILLS